MPDNVTTTQQNYPEFAMPYAQGFLQRAQQVTDQPYQQYLGGRVAGMSPWQEQGLQAQAARGMQGSQVMSGANSALQGFFGNSGPGAAQNQYGPVSAQANQYGPIAASTNPYGQAQAAQNQYGPVQASQNQFGPAQAAQNQYGPVQAQGNGYGYVAPQSNPYAGSNPYLGQQIDAAQGDLARNWNNVAAPQWASNMQSSGSFGNSGVASAQALAMEGLQRNMGNIGSSMRMQDYTQQQQLGENSANRNLQAGQFNAGLAENYANRNLQAAQFNSGMGENYANRQTQNSQFNAGMGENLANRQMQASQFNSSMGENLANRQTQTGQFNAGLGESFAGRQMQAGQFNAGLGENFANRAMQAGQFNSTMGENYAGRQDSMYGQGQNRQLSALGMAPGFAQQDYNDINNLQQAGQAYQNQQQRQMDAGYQQYLDARQYPQQQLGVFGQALGQAVGNQGSRTTTEPGASAGATLAGGALLGSQLYNLLGLGQP